jgi:hypothetical protein
MLGYVFITVYISLKQDRLTTTYFYANIVAMLKSTLLLRPWTAYDPANKDHRRYFNNFIKTRSWAGCPYQWLIMDDSGDVVHYLTKVTAEYYLSREFVAKNHKKVVKKW